MAHEIQLIESGDYFGRGWDTVWLSYPTPSSPNLRVISGGIVMEDNDNFPDNIPVEAGEFFITKFGLAWATNDGSGGVQPITLNPNIPIASDFNGSSGDDTLEIAYDSGTEKLKWHNPNGHSLMSDNTEVRGDINGPAPPTITQIRSKSGGVGVQGDMDLKSFLFQGGEFYVSVDQNKPQVPPPDGPNWTQWGTQPDFQIEKTYNNISDGETRWYALRSWVTQINGNDVYAESPLVEHTYSYDPESDPPTTAPYNLTISGYQSGTNTMEGTMTVDNATSAASELQYELYENGSSLGIGGVGNIPSSVTFDSYGSDPSSPYEGTPGYTYYFRARYVNDAGSGPWSNFSNDYTIQ